jgi:hypothetical protein
MTVETVEPITTPAAPVVTAPVVVAPVTPPAVVTPPAPAPVIGDASPAADITVVEYEATGDPGLDLALAFVGNLGIGTDHPAMKAAMAGDYTLIEYTLAQMGDKAKGWENHVALAKAADAKAAEGREATATATKAACEKAAGGAQAWTDIQKWAAENADAEEKAAINQLFDSGPVGARLVATALKVMFAQAKGTVITPADPTRGVSGTNANTNAALSPREYHAEIQSLKQRLGRGFETSDEYAALGRRLRR